MRQQDLAKLHIWLDGRCNNRTYTIANELEIRKKFVELNGCVPHNVTIQTWYSFLLQHGVRPFQGVVLDDKVNGMILVNEKSGKDGFKS